MGDAPPQCGLRPFFNLRHGYTQAEGLDSDPSSRTTNAILAKHLQVGRLFLIPLFGVGLQAKGTTTFGLPDVVKTNP